MSINLRYPNITGLSEKEQLSQVKSFLHQLVDQLNYALPNLNSGETASPSTSAQSDDISYSELRAFVIQELQEIENRFDKLSIKMQAEYVSDEELPEAIEDALTQAKASGEFDGEQGPQGPQGIQGIQGEPGIQGIPGEPGFSPTVSIIEIPGGHRVVITDAEGTQSFDVMDGEDGTGGGGEAGGSGEDGFSPTITVEEIKGGHRLTITDIDSTKTVDVMDGVDGAAGPQGEKGDQGPKGEQGVQGDKGDPGADGFSPTVEVEKIDGGHRVSITDASSTKQFDVMNGINGLHFKLDDGTNLY